MSAMSERMRELMMAALDGEIGAAERRELDEYLDRHPDAAAEWQRLTRVKEVTNTMTPRQPGHDVWQNYWTSVYSRLERGIGWVLFSIGAILLTGYGIWQAIDSVFADRTVPDIVRVGIMLTMLGTAILLISVIREKIFVNRREPFKDVTR